MAVAASIKKQAKVPGSERRTVTEVTFDNSLALGGEPITAKELGLRVVDYAECIVKSGSEAEATAVGSVWLDTSAMKLRVNDYKTQKEMVEGKDLSKVVVIVFATGR